MLVLALVAVSGCGIEDPYATDEEDGSGDQPAVVAETVDQAALPRGAKQAVERFAAAWIDWTSNDSPEGREALGELSAAALERELFRDGETAGALPGAQVTAQVEGVVPKGAGRALVVTHEKVRFESGGTQARYAVYIARAQQLENGWEVVEWQPVL